MNREMLEKLYDLNDPATFDMISDAERELGRNLHPDYTSFLKLSNGLTTNGDLVLLEVEDIAIRNRDYEVGTYLPDYLMIGDDNGGVAILLKNGESTVFEVDMGVMDEEDIKRSAISLEQLLVEYKGLPLGERQRK